MKLNIPGYDKDDIDCESVSRDDVVEYLNSVILIYGSPCNFCKHFNDYGCNLPGHRPREYDLSVGPYESWYIRKHCGDIEPIDITKEQDDTIALKTELALSCAAQQYCGYGK